MLVKHSSTLHNFVLPEALEASSRPLQLAVEALNALDTGNRMVEKCTTFLERLEHVLASLSKCLYDYRYVVLANGSIAASPSAAMMYQAPMPEHDASHIDSQTFQDSLTQTAGQLPQTMQQSPLGMDLGEFMIESDLDFLNYFRIPPSGPNNANGHGLAPVGTGGLNNVPRNNMYNP